MNEVQPILGVDYRDKETFLHRVVIAGKIGSGKSTALNNIFDLQLSTGSSPTQVTKSVSCSKVSKNGNVFEVIDTPGLGGIHQTTGEVIEEIKRNLPDSNFILLYCLPVKPSDTLTETDRNILRNITTSFGKKVWKKCIILLTFSDIAERELKENSEYLEYLKSHVTAFRDQIKAKVSISEPKITGLSSSTCQISLGQIAAIPVRRDLGANKDCTSEILNRIVQMAPLTRSTDERSLVKKTHMQHIKFALIGAGIGCIIGILINPLLMIIGALIGAIIGFLISWLSIRSFRS